jgi:hypothetical protein
MLLTERAIGSASRRWDEIEAPLAGKLVEDDDPG